MALDLGALVARIVVEDEGANRTLTMFMASMKSMSGEAAKATAGTADLDDALAAVSKSGTSAAAGLDRATIATKATTTAQERAAATAKAQADAQARLAGIQTDVAGSSSKVQAALLRQAAAQERASLAAGSGSTQFARMASAEAALINASRAAEKAQGSLADKMASSGKTISKYGTLPVIAAAAVAVDQAAKYQKSLNTIAVATDQTTHSMSEGSKGLENIAVDTGQSLSQLSDALYTASKSGEPMSRALATVAAAAKGASAEGADLGTATQALTSIMQSYGKTLGNPVQAENELIRGAGLAKTTYQDFAASLANVIPLASSLGLSFAQVAGAEDTMTQHGETAQRASDNLANLVTNLAGQNNVASKSLQQLGVDTVDLSKNLGARGLTGSLNVVLDAINKHGHDGEIVTSAFKQAAVATRSLQTEINSLPKSMQANAAAFVRGTMSYKDFYDWSKSLGGQQYAMAKDLITTQRAAQGFNSQLTSGNSTTRTLAATLKTALGGVTGMRTALMLSGSSASTFSGDVDKISQAARQSGSDILGWAQTQSTLTNKLDRSKESLQVLAVEAGDVLLPILAKVATDAEGLIHWFDGLSHTDRELVGWGLVVVAAIGPVVSVIGNTAKAVNGLILVGGKLGTFFATLREGNQAVSGLASAVGGAGLGFAIGEMTQNTSNATKAIGVLGSTAAGAALGFSMGGPVGAAIGGLAGGLTDLVTAWHNNTSAAKASAAATAAYLHDQDTAANSLLETLKQVNGVYAKTAKTQVLNQLQQSGVLYQTGKLGINPNQLLQAVLGGGPNHEGIQYILAEVQDALGGKTSPLVDKISNEIAAITTGGRKAEQTWEFFQQALGKSLVPMKELSGGLANLGREMTKSRDLTVNTADATGVLNAEAQRNTAVIQTNAKYLQRQAALQLEHGKSVKSVTAAYNANIATLGRQLVKMGFIPSQVAKILASYHSLPKNVVSKIEAEDRATAALKSLQNYIKTHTWDVTVRVNQSGQAMGYVPGVGYTQIQPKKHATGGYIAGAGTSTSDSIPAMLSNGEEVENADATRRNRFALDAANHGATLAIAHFARGGVAGGGTSGPFNLGALLGPAVTAIETAMAHLLPPALSQIGQLLAHGVAAATVSSAIAKSVTPTSTNPTVLASQLGAATSKATDKTAAANTALVYYQSTKKAAADLQKTLDHLKASDKASEDAANAHAKKLSDEAYAAHKTAESITGTTSADKAAKAAAEAHARALDAQARKAKENAEAISKANGRHEASLQKLVTAADKTASKTKAAYDKIKSAAQAADGAAEQAAQNLVSQVASEFDDLQQQISSFITSIASDLTSGSDLASVWGSLGDAVQTASDNLDQAKQTLQDAQAAVTQATPDTTAYTAAMQAQADALAQVNAAHQALTQAQQTGNSATILAAQQAQTAAAQAYTTAIANAASAQQDLTSAAGPTADQLQAVTDAQTALTKAQNDYNQAVAADTVSGLQAKFNQLLANTQKFASDLAALQQEAGSTQAAQSFISQIAGMGVDAGDALAQQLLAAGPAGVNALVTTMGQIQDVANQSGATLAQGFYGQGVNALQQLLNGLEKEFPDLVSALQPYLTQLQAMFTITPTITAPVVGDPTGGSSTGSGSSSTGSGKKKGANPPKKHKAAPLSDQDLSELVASVMIGAVPGFATGVTNFEGGLAYVHGGELLTNLPAGTDVIPASKVMVTPGGTTTTSATLHPADRELLTRVATAMETRPVQVLIDHHGKTVIGEVANDHRQTKRLAGNGRYR